MRELRKNKTGQRERKDMRAYVKERRKKPVGLDLVWRRWFDLDQKIGPREWTLIWAQK